jgi:hypothetical protein
MGSLWSFLAKPENQKTLSWLGGGAVVVFAGLWAAFVYFFPPKKDGESPAPQVKFGASVKSGDCSIATSGTGNYPPPTSWDPR